MTYILLSTVVALVLVVLKCVQLYIRDVRLDRIMPPSPPGLPLLGNLFDLPTFRPWLTYNRWARTYGKLASLRVLAPWSDFEAGDVVYMLLPFQPVIILNSTRAALDLMDKRSSIYSDKLFTTLDEMYALFS